MTLESAVFFAVFGVGAALVLAFRGMRRSASNQTDGSRDSTESHTPYYGSDDGGSGSSDAGDNCGDSSDSGGSDGGGCDSGGDGGGGDGGGD